MLLFLLIATVSLGGLNRCRSTPSRPAINVVLVSIDSLRADHVHAYGYRRKTTPTLDRLARDGALFGNVIAESSWTLPTHVTMLTGLPANVHGVEQFSGSRLSSGAPTLAELFRDEGYHTYGVFSGPYLHPAFGLARGFERYQDAQGNVACVEGECNTDPDVLETDEQIRAAHHEAHRTVTSPMVTQRAIDFLRAHREEPFFLFLHYFDVHYDYMPPEEYWRKFDPKYDGAFQAKDFERNPAVHPFMEARELRHVLALYDGEILFTDFHIGRLVRALRRLGLYDETLLVITSDHGDEFFEHRGKGHGRTLFDEVLKVPLILTLPGRIPPGMRIDAQITQQEITPTILELAGVDARGRVEGPGTDLSRWLAKGAEPLSRAAVSRLRRDDLSVSFRTNAFKLLLHRNDGTESISLFDLRADAREKNPILKRHQVAVSRSAEAMFEELWEKLGGGRGPLGKQAWDPAPEKEAELPEEVRESLRSLGYIP